MVSLVVILPLFCLSPQFFIWFIPLWPPWSCHFGSPSPVFHFLVNSLYYISAPHSLYALTTCFLSLILRSIIKVFLIVCLLSLIVIYSPVFQFIFASLLYVVRLCHLSCWSVLSCQPCFQLYLSGVFISFYLFITSPSILIVLVFVVSLFFCSVLFLFVSVFPALTSDCVLVDPAFWIFPIVDWMSVFWPWSTILACPIINVCFPLHLIVLPHPHRAFLTQSESWGFTAYCKVICVMSIWNILHIWSLYNVYISC